MYLGDRDNVFPILTQHIATTFPLVSGKTFCRVSNFSGFKMYLKFFNLFRLARHTYATSRGAHLIHFMGGLDGSGTDF